jgi:hypothetical protein
MFCGTGISAIATEDFLDNYNGGKSAEDVISDLIVKGDRMVRCCACNRLIFLKKTPAGEIIRFFRPDDD